MEIIKKEIEKLEIREYDLEKELENVRLELEECNSIINDTIED